ncbi:MAG TPA: MEDS domain-containing protein [Steroidobacteraceae bacterium]|nr:MEDS domain-containing protein [Steroidobacteraceae bacterium]
MAGQGRARRGISSDGVSFQGHCCCFYEQSRERLAILAGFFGTALERREKCIYVARRGIAGALESYLQAAGIDVTSALEDGALEWRRAEETYGSVADPSPSKWMSVWRQAARRAEREGFAGLAVASEAPRGARSGRRASQWIGYERRLTQTISQLGGTFLCIYNRRATSLRVALELLRAHPTGLASGIIGRSVYYMPVSEAPHLSSRVRHERKRERVPAVPPEATGRQSHAGIAQLSRIFTMGALTASIAHEVRQPLAAIAANANAGLRWLEGAQARADLARRSLRRVLRDATRAADVIKHIRSLAARGTVTPGKGSLSINTVVRNVVGLMEREIRSANVILRLLLADAVPEAIGDEVQLQQVLLNLLTNALEEMERLRRRTREIAILTQRGADGSVIVTVCDSGRPASPASLARAFEPFYTTKPQGMGIGLSICRAVVEEHGGRIWATPNGSRGACFHFSLPPRRTAHR